MKATLKAHLIKSTLIVAVLLSLPILAHGANVSLTTSDTINTSSFNAAGKWGNAQAPSAANDYYTSTFFMRTPGDGGNITYTFAGNSLTLQAPAGQGSPMRSILVKSGNNDTFIINNLTNAGGGVINNGGSGNVTVTFTGNQWTMAGNATIISDQGSTIIGYPIVGSFNLTNSGSTQSGVHQTTFTGSLSGFTGRMILLNLGGGMVVNLNSGTSNLGNPAIFTPDQWSIGVGCAITDNAGLTFNNPNAGFTLTGNGTINAAATTVIAEPITGGFTFTKGGAGTLTLSAANTYSGATVISAGTLQIGVANALTNTGSVTDNSVLDLNTFSITIDALSGSGSVDTLAGGTPTLTVGANNGSGTLSGLIQNSSGTMSLTKIGSGTETLSGGYSYSGATTVAGGTLSLNSALSLPASPGNLVISNGAVLTANVSSGIPLPANNLVVGTNSTLALTLNSAANGINVAGNLTLQDNATNNFNYGSLTANPTGTNINVAGGISAPGSSIVINITALGLKPGTITLIKYTGPALGSIANFSLSAPPGVVATLVNNTGNDSIDLNITSTPNQLAWNGVNGTGWDLAIANWTNIITGGITVFRQYTNGSIIAGDSVLFDDSVTNDLVNPQPTNIVLTSTFYAFPLVVNSTLPYSISGAGGITGVTSLVKSNTGSLTLLTSNSFAGGVFINDSGSLIITNDSALGASSGAVTLNGGTLQINGGVTNSRAIPMPVTSTIGVGAGATARLGGVISGVSSLNKTDNGTLILAGAETFTGDLFPHAGTLVFDTGASLTNGSYHSVGQNGNDVATLTLKGTGSISTTSDFNMGDLDNAAGTLNVQDTATLTANAIYVASANAAGSTASGTVNQSGGTVNQLSATAGTFAIGGRTSASGVAVYNISGGTINATAGIRVGGAGTGTINQSGGTINARGGLNIARLAGSTGTNNLNGGTLSTLNVASSTGVNAIFNFNGGTLQANFTPANPFMSGLSQANILAGGAFIDSSNNSVTISQPLLAGSANGGLTKLGTGSLTLSGNNTFTGPITNKAGTLTLSGTSTYPGAVQINAGTLGITTASTITGNTIVSNGSTFSITQIGSATASVSNLTFNGAASGPGATLGLTMATANNPAIPLANCGTLTLSGTNTVSLAAVNVGTLALVKYFALAGSGNITNLNLPQGATGYISNNAANSTLYAVVTSTGPGLVWTGTNNVAGKTNLWDINTTTNWLVGASPTSYHQIISPGDSVIFNDIGSGTVLLSNNVAPASVVISNNSKAYTFTGTGNVSGSTGLQKLGSGTAILNLTNNGYLGDTVISNGTVQLGGVSAIPSSGNVIIGPTGTLELAGLSPTLGELTGSGTLDNNNGIPPVLTIGKAGGTWNGTITNIGGGGILLNRVGNGTWIVGGKNYLNNGQPFGQQSTISGTVIITNGGLFSISDVELRIASAAGQTGTVVVAGGTLNVALNVLSVGYGGATANGTLTVNSGTIIHGGGANGAFASVANSIDVGAQGATGTLIVNGGQVLNPLPLFLGDGATANGTLYLNGGLVQATVVRPNNAPATSIAYFNGGTLQAATNSTDFLQVTSMVMSNGLVLDDNGNSVSIVSQPLQNGDAFNGGLIKKGAGTVYLDAANTYTGTTLVTNGTLAGVGSITGPVVVAPNGNLGAGDAAGVGTLNINNNLALQGNATLRINRDVPNSDLVNLVGNINYGGTLTISNLSTTPLTTSDTFQLFSVTGSKSGNFAGISGSPGTGLAYSFSPASGVLSIITALTPANITFSVSGSTLSLSWPADHLGWILTRQTNDLSVGLSTNWTDVPGTAAVTSTNITINPANPTVFFRLRSP